MKKYNMSLFLLTNSPWPLLMSLSVSLLLLNLVYFFNGNNSMNILTVNFLIVISIMMMWWFDVITESTFSGFHNKYIMKISIYGMILFIISEIFFFISFFWTFFHMMISPDVFIGSMWPYKGVYCIDYMNLPLLNSLLLISSGAFISLSHYKILSNNLKSAKLNLFITFSLGLEFLLFQMIEYKMSFFCFSDGIFGSIFFIATGFHGIHVLIGSIFLICMFLRMTSSHFSFSHLMGYEFAIWYWHFVDVVWLYLYMMVYWLGS